jgi:flagellar biosynthesis/type III secretory pathway chaperone
MFAFAPAVDDEPFEDAAPHHEVTPPVVAVDAVDVAEDMLLAMNRLADLLEVENEALGRNRYEVTAAIQDEKASLTRLYVQRLKALAEDQKRLEQARAERGEDMRESAERLKRLSDLNAILLRSNMEATQRFLDAVVTSAREYENQPRYARNGAVNAVRNPASLTFNQTL